jgi:ribosomal protein S27AE
MLASDIGGIVVLGINAFSHLPGIPLFLGGVSGLTAAGKSQKPVVEPIGFQSPAMTARADVSPGGSQPDVPLGTLVATSARFCSNCGAQVADTAKFCEKCGSAVVALSSAR